MFRNYLSVAACLMAARATFAVPSLPEQYCNGCHSAKRKAGGLNLEQFQPAQSAASREIAEKVVLRLRAGMMPPPGQPRPPAQQQRDYVEQLEASLDHLAASLPAQGPPTFRLLSRAEYVLAVRDLLGIEIDGARLLPADTISGGFDNLADAQRFSPVMINGYLRAASAAATLAAASKKTYRITELTARAWRGQGTPDDLRQVRAAYTKGGLHQAIEVMLTNPRFLVRTELASPDLAMATRLSFFLWGSIPDEALLAAARQGRLHRPAGIEAQVRRMLASPMTGRFAERFASQWLRLQDISVPGSDAEFAASLRRETILFFNAIVREDRPVTDLLEAPWSFVNTRLAQHYGLAKIPQPSEGFVRVAMEGPRRGITGQGSMLASTSVTGRTSPVLRGKWILEVLLGITPPPPPPNVPALDESARPVTAAGKALSTRQRIEKHRSNPSCNACHRYIDPLGIALENFTETGAWRDVDNGVPVDAAGALHDGTPVNGPEGLRSALLARQDLFLRAFAERLLTFALGRQTSPADMPAIRAIAAAGASRENRISAFIQAVTASRQLRQITPSREPPQ